jgi:hypothetical protein
VSGAERGVLRVLRMAIADEGRRDRILNEALRSAGRTELPETPSGLLRFVRSHLAPQLKAQIEPNLVLALIDDVTAEIEQVAGGKHRMQAATAPPSAPPAEAVMAPPPTTNVPPEPIAAPKAGFLARISLPKLRKSVSDLVRTTSTRLRAVLGAQTKRLSVSDSDTRPAVLLVHSDRFLRASIARALVAARFDVSVFDTAGDAARSIGHTDTLVAIADVHENGMPTALQALMAATTSSGLHVVAWTDAPHAETEQILTTAGVTRFCTVSRAASAKQLIESVQRLLAS